MRRLLKWGIVAFVLAEVYARGGREFLFGSRDEDSFGVGETLRTWVDLPQGWQPNESLLLPLAVNDDSGNEVGSITRFRHKSEARDKAGYPSDQVQAYVEAFRLALGYPINVALAQLGDYTRRSLGIG